MFVWDSILGADIHYVTISLLKIERKTLKSNPAVLDKRSASVEAELEVKGSRAKRVESLEAVEASVEVLMVMVTLLALRVHGVFTVVKLGSHL